MYLPVTTSCIQDTSRRGQDAQISSGKVGFGTRFRASIVISSRSGTCSSHRCWSPHLFLERCGALPRVVERHIPISDHSHTAGIICGAQFWPSLLPIKGWEYSTVISIRSSSLWPEIGPSGVRREEREVLKRTYGGPSDKMRGSKGDEK